jgi:hypothetical protein
MCAYEGGTCSIELHVSRWDPIREVFSLKFEPAIKSRVITQWAACYCFITCSKESGSFLLLQDSLTAIKQDHRNECGQPRKTIDLHDRRSELQDSVDVLKLESPWPRQPLDLAKAKNVKHNLNLKPCTGRSSFHRERERERERERVRASVEITTRRQRGKTQIREGFFTAVGAGGWSLSASRLAFFTRSSSSCSLSGAGLASTSKARLKKRKVSCEPAFLVPISFTIPIISSRSLSVQLLLFACSCHLRTLQRSFT